MSGLPYCGISFRFNSSSFKFLVGVHVLFEGCDGTDYLAVSICVRVGLRALQHARARARARDVDSSRLINILNLW